MTDLIKAFEEYCQKTVFEFRTDSDGTIFGVRDSIIRKSEFLKHFNTEGTAYANKLLDKFDGDKNVFKEEISKISAKYVQILINK